MRLLTIVILAFSMNANAQTATNFNIDDIDGHNRDLFTELDANQVVVLKFFTSWCSICNATADEVIDIYNAYQTNGDPVAFWALDRDQNETNAHATTYRNTHNIPFPVIGEAYSVAQQFGVVYQPEYYIVRPDRSYVKRTNYNLMNTAVQEALDAMSTGIEENGFGYSIEIAGNMLTWNAEPNDEAVVNVSDMTGRIVLTKHLSGTDSVVLNDLTVGVYTYAIEVDQKIIASGKIGIVK